VEIPEALKLIAGHSSIVQHEAIKALRASGQAQQTRYNIVAEHALTDHDATFTPDERDAILVLIDWPEEGSRTRMFPMRFTEAEYAEARDRADRETGGNLAELIRRLVLES
jgi:hypothetical protein